jgi:hypothetical protein
MNESQDNFGFLEDLGKDLDCLDRLMRANYFESAKYLLEFQFNPQVKEGADESQTRLTLKQLSQA